MSDADEPTQERLDELQQDIDEARDRAQEHGTLHDPDEQTFIDPDPGIDHPLDDPGTITG